VAGLKHTTIHGILAIALVAFAMIAVVCMAEGGLDALTGDSCVTCHIDAEYLPEGLVKEEIHFQVGLSCAGCHGGDPTKDDQDEAMSTAAGFVGVPSIKETPAFCGKCHSDIEFMRRYQPRIQTDQVRQYLTSGHGLGLTAGDENVAVCTSCHTAHGVLPASDTRSSVYPLNVPGTCNVCHGDADHMSASGLPTDQFVKFKQSVHGVALLDNQDTGAPACNDCHGNHGAAPPDVSSVAQICGQCHVNNMEYFSASKMGQVWDEKGYRSCQECHGNHEVRRTFDDMVGTGDQAVCINCHGVGEKGFEAAGRIHELLAELVDAHDEAEAQRAKVARRGMEDEEIGFLIQEAHQDLVQSRTLVHTFDPDRIAEKTKQGVAKASDAMTLGIEQIKEFHHRRRGLGLATIFITLLIVALYFKIRQMEGN
jgi:hypothetical protein